MAKIHESAIIYKGDRITNTFIEGGYLVVVCESAVYRIDLGSREVTRLM